jgi:hypothetical protein
MKHKLTNTERIRGVRGAIASPRTPEHLKEFLIRQLRRLEARSSRSVRAGQKSSKRRALLWWPNL